MIIGSDGHGAGYPELNRSQTAWNRPGIETVRDRFWSGGKKLPENRLNRTKEPRAGSPDHKFQGAVPESGTGPDRFTRPNGSLEPDSEPSGSLEPIKN